MADTAVVKETIDAINAIQEDTSKHVCKRCGWDQRQEYDVASSELLRDYFKCMLGQVPFQKTYELFNGVLTVVFEEPTGKLLRLQEKEASKRLANKDNTISDALDFAIIPALVSIALENEGVGRKYLYQADAGRRERLLEDGVVPPELDNMPLVSLQAVRNTYGEFSQLCARLVRASQDENFWQGDGRN